MGLDIDTGNIGFHNLSYTYATWRKKYWMKNGMEIIIVAFIHCHIGPTNLGHVWNTLRLAFRPEFLNGTARINVQIFCMKSGCHLTKRDSIGFFLKNLVVGFLGLIGSKGVQNDFLGKSHFIGGFWARRGPKWD